MLNMLVGEDALKMISSKNIDLIILDLNLPKISGISLLNIIKQRNFIQYKNSIIIITGENISKKPFLIIIIFILFSKSLLM